MSDTATAEGQTVQQRKGIMTPRNALVAFSVISGAVSVVSAFSPTLPIDWSETMTNILAGYHALIRDPLIALAHSVGLGMSTFAGDVLVLYFAFILPTFGKFLFLVSRMSPKSSMEKWCALILALVGMYFLMAAAPLVNPANWKHLTWAWFAPSALMAIMFGTALFLTPLAAWLDTDSTDKSLKRMAISAYARTAFVGVMIALILFSNRALVGYGY